MRSIHLATYKSVADGPHDNTTAMQQRNDRYPTFTVAALPVAPSPSSIAIWSAALGMGLLCAWLLVA